MEVNANEHPRKKKQCHIDITTNGAKQTPRSLISKALLNDNFNITIISNSNYKEFQLYKTNDLYAPAESKHYSESISNCHFTAHSDDNRHSFSLCDEKDLTGFIVFQNNRYGVFSQNENFVMVSYIEDTCEFPLRRKKRESAVNRNPSYIEEHLDGKKRYVELALIADYSIYTKYDSDIKKVNDYLQTTINILNSLYYPLNIHITLVHSEIWAKGNQINVVADSRDTLQNFMDYKKVLLKDHLFDTGYLLTTFKFDDGVVGKAYKGTMCSYDWSGGIYVDHNKDMIETVATFAHELGHTFGMDHDPDDRELCNCPMPKCIMSPQSGHMEVWSECSIKNLASGFNRGIDLCLFNEPGKRPSDSKCGNGVVEPGEECDCGPLGCLNTCCNTKTCQLTENSLCASGECCDTETCQPKPRATICRKAIGICDLNEYCNGETSDCPADFFVQNGALCPGRDNEFCYDGKCGSRPDQCIKLWGDRSDEGDTNCYRRNTEGNFYGNCGYNPHNKEFRKCLPENRRCGLLHCETTAERPVFGDPGSVTFAHSSVYSALEPRQQKFCFVIKSAYSGINNKDPGLVPDGAECDNNKICVNQKCQKRENIARITPQCKDECNFRGLCNNVGNCHCDRGFGGIACEIPGYGGSVNSNEAYKFRGITLPSVFLLFFLLFCAFFMGYCVYNKIKRRRNIPNEIWSFFKKKFELHGELVPVRAAPPPPYARSIRRSIAAMWGDTSRSGNTMSSEYTTCDTNVNYPSRMEIPAIPLVNMNNKSEKKTNDSSSTNDERTIDPYYNNRINRIKPPLRPNVEPPPIPRPTSEALSRLQTDLQSENCEKKRNKIKHQDNFRPVKSPPPPPPPPRMDSNSITSNINRGSEETNVKSGTSAEPHLVDNIDESNIVDVKQLTSLFDK